MSGGEVRYICGHSFEIQARISDGVKYITVPPSKCPQCFGTGYTPGPWNVAKFIPSSQRIDIHSPEISVCSIDINGQVPNEVELSDAQLIAAAPDLLEALENLLGELPVTSGNETLNTLIDDSRAAIAKARGRSIPD